MWDACGSLMGTVHLSADLYYNVNSFRSMPSLCLLILCIHVYAWNKVVRIVYSNKKNIIIDISK
jgi:hypothetical protein